MKHTIALFGEAQKGEFQTAYYCQSLPQLADHLGEPPSEESHGLGYAVQALLYNKEVVFFRVREEGFSSEDYLFGLHFLKEKERFPKISALCLPGVGDAELIEATTPVCHIHKSFLIISERDLYDYLTSKT